MDRRAARSLVAQIGLLTDSDGDHPEIRERAHRPGGGPARAAASRMPAHHDVPSSDVFTRRLHGTLAAAAEQGSVDFPELLLTPRIAARKVQYIAMVAEVVHGAVSFSGPRAVFAGSRRQGSPTLSSADQSYDETIRHSTHLWPSEK